MGDSVVYAIKIALAVAATMVFASALITFLSLLAALTSSTILGEIIGLISVYLPFSAATVFGSMSTTIVAIISFLVARKIWELTGHTYKMS